MEKGTKKNEPSSTREIRLYNTLTRSVDLFVPGKEGAVSIYNCGPTVYDAPHLGNYRSFVMSDILRRVFEYNDYRVVQAMNITDVDDKTIKKSREESVSLSVVTGRYEKIFLEGNEALNILRPTHLLRATEHIDAMVAIITTLLDKGYAYKANDGIYMHIGKIANYGALAGLERVRDQDSRSRIRNDEYDKEDPHDFALWKFSVPEDGDVRFDAPFGSGRPGWHIECSAMSMEALGDTIDIHTGGSDLIFPHHTNEIAQSECVTGKTFVRYWIHGAPMNVGGDKMSKSKGNFLKLEDLAAETISPLAFRYWLLTAHYRSPVSFTLEAVRGAQSALMRLMKSVSSLPGGGAVADTYADRFRSAINDDMDMSTAVALVWEIIKDEGLSGADKRTTILDFDRVLGLRLNTVISIPEDEIPAEIVALADAREDARKKKDWVKADALRHEIEERGYTVSDTKDGIKIAAA